jgi:hypothetical protein
MSKNQTPPSIAVDIEEREGPPLRVIINTRNPRTAVRAALEANEGPGLATVQGHPNVWARAYKNGTIVVSAPLKGK